MLHTAPYNSVEIKSNANPDVFAPFGSRNVCGDDQFVGRGKPHPDIFLIAARKGLGLQETLEGYSLRSRIREPGAHADGTFLGGEGEVLVFEDALVSWRTMNNKLTQPGVQAAKAAGMKGMQKPVSR